MVHYYVSPRHQPAYLLHHHRVDILQLVPDWERMLCFVAVGEPEGFHLAGHWISFCYPHWNPNDSL